MSLYFTTFQNFEAGVEGGYVDDPNGGPTYGGVRQAYLNQWLISQHAPLMDVRELADRPELLDAYYMANYFLPLRIYDLLDYPAPALVVYDGGISQGPGTIVKMLQRVVGAAEDGVIGPVTLAKVHDYVKNIGAWVLVTSLIGQRRQAYINNNQPANEKGWMHRLDRLEARCRQL